MYQVKFSNNREPEAQFESVAYIPAREALHAVFWAGAYTGAYNCLYAHVTRGEQPQGPWKATGATETINWQALQQTAEKAYTICLEAGKPLKYRVTVYGSFGPERSMEERSLIIKAIHPAEAEAIALDQLKRLEGLNRPEKVTSGLEWAQ